MCLYKLTQKYRLPFQKKKLLKTNIYIYVSKTGEKTIVLGFNPSILKNNNKKTEQLKNLLR